jgi:hypothetical protein
MAKKTKGVKSGKKKSGKKKSTGKKAAAKMTLHSLYDAIDAFEKAVQGGSHRRKADIIKQAEKSKQEWKALCLALNADGDCEKPVPSFCDDPIKP